MFKKEDKQKVSKEMADNEFERWADMFEIDTDLSAMEDGDVKSFNDFKSKLVKRITSGLLVIDDNGTITFTPRDSGIDFVFPEPQGTLLSAKMKNDTEVQSVRRVLAAWTGRPPKDFAEMRLKDFGFCSALFAFFANS